MLPVLTVRSRIPTLPKHRIHNKGTCTPKRLPLERPFGPQGTPLSLCRRVAWDCSGAACRKEDLSPASGVRDAQHARLHRRQLLCTRRSAAEACAAPTIRTLGKLLWAERLPRSPKTLRPRRLRSEPVSRAGERSEGSTGA